MDAIVDQVAAALSASQRCPGMWRVLADEIDCSWGEIAAL